MQFAHLTMFPFVHVACGIFGHRVGIPGNLRALQGWGGEFSVSSPVSTLGGEKSLPEQFGELMGDDIEMDFDMMIDKAPGTDTKTPWHQDAAYWPNMEDKRALSFWIALDDADQENGCMMYVHGSHQRPILPHNQPKPNAALQCEVSHDDDIVYGEIPSGDAIVHHGYTLHAALGNKSSDRHRRALIINLRPKAMIDYMRNLGYDHLGKREIKNKV
jgi:hypothetical protein